MKPDFKKNTNNSQQANSYTPKAAKRDDIPALEQHNYIQDRQPTYMRASVKENFDKRTHRHWVSNLLILFSFIILILGGYYWWSNMDGKYFFRLVQLSTYSDSNISIALPKNYQNSKTDGTSSNTIKYYRNNAGDKVLSIVFIINKSSAEDSEKNRDASKIEILKDPKYANISTSKSNGAYILNYDEKNINVTTKHIKEVYFNGKNYSYRLTFYDDMTDSDFAGSISYIISTLEIK